MTLARKLAEAVPVLVVESGGLEADPDVEALQLGESVGIGYPLMETRTRQFGGSSALWGGYCAIFDPHEFERRDWVPGSGWPFGAKAIEPYYEEIAKLLNLGEPNFDPRDIAVRAGVVLPFDNETVVPSVWRFGTPTARFGEQLREEFEESRDLTTLINANVVDIRLDSEHSLVTEVVIRTLSGREGRIAADIFVLACGGIETPRILLNANTQVRHGLGNGSDMVGRFFMDHPHLAVPSLILRNESLFRGWTERGSYDDNRQFLSCVGLSAQAQKETQILNARAHIYRTPSMTKDESSKVGIFLEQAPNPMSRIILTDDVDSLGLRRVRLDWQFTELDWKTYEQTASLLAREFERIDAGRMLFPSQPTTRKRELVLHTSHQLGTTRMSQNPEDGVVNSDCRLHDLGNLYIAGGSVFPTAGWANPTFTVIALALRLADHLRSELD